MANAEPVRILYARRTTPPKGASQPAGSTSPPSAANRHSRKVQPSPVSLNLVGRRQCRQVMVDVGFREVGSAHRNSALSSKAVLRWVKSEAYEVDGADHLIGKRLPPLHFLECWLEEGVFYQNSSLTLAMSKSAAIAGINSITLTNCRKI